MQTFQKQSGRPEFQAHEDTTFHIEPTWRWVRVKFNESYVADSKRVLLVWENGRLPSYYFPVEDVRQEWLQINRTGTDGRTFYDLSVGERVAKSCAWNLPQVYGIDSIEGEYITFKWNKMDHWFEEEEEVFAHPRDPYHRVDTIRSSRHIKVVIDGITVAESTRPLLLFETGLPTRYYLPQDDVCMEYLVPSRAETICPYKGTASYWSVVVGGQEYRNLVWGYMAPISECSKINGLLSFFNEKVDIFLDGKLEERPRTPWS